MDVEYILTNHQGSTVAALDSSGALITDSEKRYMPFGDVRSDLTTSSQTDYGYTGQREIEGSELMDYKARFLNPGLGRFTQPDTIIPNPANPQSLNRYSYVRNNPINLIDPTGHGDMCPDPVACGEPPPPPPDDGCELANDPLCLNGGDGGGNGGNGGGNVGDGGGNGNNGGYQGDVGGDPIDALVYLISNCGTDSRCIVRAKEKLLSNYSSWGLKVLLLLVQGGSDGLRAARYIFQHNVHFYFVELDNNTGASVLHPSRDPRKWGHIYLYSKRFSEDTPVSPVLVALIAHEVEHLIQGPIEAFSIYGELEAYNTQIRVLNAFGIYDSPLNAITDNPLNHGCNNLENVRNDMLSVTGIDDYSIYPRNPLGYIYVSFEKSHDGGFGPVLYDCDVTN